MAEVGYRLDVRLSSMSHPGTRVQRKLKAESEEKWFSIDQKACGSGVLATGYKASRNWVWPCLPHRGSYSEETLLLYVPGW